MVLELLGFAALGFVAKVELIAQQARASKNHIKPPR